MSDIILLGNKHESPMINIIEYYCSLCGETVLTSNIPLDEVPRRKTDDSYICIEGKVNIENTMKKDKLIIIKRYHNKYEKQYTYICPSCYIIIAYQSNDFEEEKKQEENNMKQETILFSKKQRKIIYILGDSLVTSAKQSSLAIEIEKIKENQAKKNTPVSFQWVKKK